MSSYVIDTNVLLVASAAHPYSPFDDSHLPASEQEQVFEWLAEFRSDAGSRLVLDDLFKIYDEYRNKLNDQDYGLQVVSEKFQTLRTVKLEWDVDGHAVVPQPFENFDRSDRKFLAAALSDSQTISIVNAADSDWLEIEPELSAAGVEVVHIVEPWLRSTYSTK